MVEIIYTFFPPSDIGLKNGADNNFESVYIRKTVPDFY